MNDRTGPKVRGSGGRAEAAGPTKTATRVDWAAELRHVREAALHGTADLAFWRDRLGAEGLVPRERDGRAEISVIATDARFLGLRFRELVCVVHVSGRPGDAPRGGFFLAQAFNSRRLFALCERTLYSTPYRNGEIRLSSSLPLSIELGTRDGASFRAEMGGDAPGSVREGSIGDPETRVETVFLPDPPRRKVRRPRLFFARIGGHVRTYPFRPAKDAVTIRTAPDGEFLQAMLNSGFAAREWSVREDAIHARSKTIDRAPDGGAPPLPGT